MPECGDRLAPGVELGEYRANVLVGFNPGRRHSSVRQRAKRAIPFWIEGIALHIKRFARARKIIEGAFLACRADRSINDRLPRHERVGFGITRAVTTLDRQFLLRIHRVRSRSSGGNRVDQFPLGRQRCRRTNRGRWVSPRSETSRSVQLPAGTVACLRTLYRLVTAHVLPTQADDVIIQAVEVQ